MSPRIGRRALMAAALTALAGARIGIAAPVAPGDAARLRTMMRGGAARAIGEAYLAQRPDERNADRLTAHIVGAADSAPGSTLPARLKTAIRQDFADGALVKVEGWTLSLTEARLCALAALG